MYFVPHSVVHGGNEELRSVYPVHLLQVIIKTCAETQRQPGIEIVDLKIVHFKPSPNFFLQTAVPKHPSESSPLPSWVQFRRGRKKKKRRKQACLYLPTPCGCHSSEDAVSISLSSGIKSSTKGQRPDISYLS